MNPNRRALGSTPGAHHGIGQQPDRQHVIEVRVAHEDVVDPRHLGQGQIAYSGSGIDQYVIVEKKGRGATAFGNGP